MDKIKENEHWTIHLPDMEQYILIQEYSIQAFESSYRKKTYNR